jgi:hypothetical protein
VLTAGALCAAAFAAIKTLNGAVVRGDFRATTAEAAQAWPTLDKTRADINMIRREFSFAAILGSDFVAAENYAQAAIQHQSQPGVSTYRLELSNELLRLAQHKAAPGSATRKALFKAVCDRMGLPGVDNIS